VFFWFLVFGFSAGDYPFVEPVRRTLSASRNIIRRVVPGRDVDDDGGDGAR